MPKYLKHLIKLTYPLAGLLPSGVKETIEEKLSKRYFNARHSQALSIVGEIITGIGLAALTGDAVWLTLEVDASARFVSSVYGHDSGTIPAELSYVIYAITKNKNKKSSKETPSNGG